MTRGNKVKKALLTGHVANSEGLEEELNSQENKDTAFHSTPFFQDSPDTYVCRHFEYCGVKIMRGRDCSHPAYRECKTWKFYQKYGEDWNGLGVGS